MKRPSIKQPTLLIALAVCLLACGSAPADANIAVGEEAPAFVLQGLDGQTVSLADLEGKTVVLEWVNPNCPFTDRHAKEKTMINLAAEHGEVVWLGINSTNPDHSNFLTKEEHQAWVDERGVTYAVLYDESGEVGKAYGAKTTPHMYIIDAGGKVVYNGAIDDDPSGRTEIPQRTNYVDGALGAMGSGAAVDPATTKPYGCSVKY